MASHDFQAALSRLVGKRCWNAIAGRGTGSHFILDFGEKVPRDQRLENPSLTATERRFRGEVSLFVECAWRLDSSKEVICGWGDSNAPGGAMVRGLRSLVGRRVSGVSVEHPARDLEVHFDDMVLRMFCERTSQADHGSNYSVFAWRSPLRGVWEGWVFAVDALGRLRREPLTPSGRALTSVRTGRHR